MNKKYFNYVYLSGLAFMFFHSSSMAYAGGGEHSEGSSGLPQFDTSTYPSQIFWLSITFIVTYLILSRVALPKIAYVLDLRNAQQDGNIAEAERLNKKANDSLKKYEESIANAHEEVRIILQQVKDDVIQKQDKAFEVFQNETQEKVKNAESSLQNSIDQAMSNLTMSASELTQQALKQLGNVTVSNEDTKKIITSIQKKTGETA